MVSTKTIKLYFGVLACFIGGSLLSVQAGVNGLLSTSIGTAIGSAFISFAIGTLALFFGPFWAGPKPDFYFAFNKENSEHVPKLIYFIAPGALGAIFVTGNTFLAPILGSLQFVGMVTGQLGLSLILDHVGFLGVAVHKISVSRVLGTLLTITGAVLAALEKINTYGNDDGDASDESSYLIPLYLCLSVLNGTPVALQPLFNAVFTSTMQTHAQRTATWSFFVGTVLLAIVWGLVILATDQSPDFSNVDWTMFLGGPMGSFYVTISTFMVPVIGTSMLVTSVVGGQLFASLLLDHFGALGYPLSTITPLRACGVAVAFLGVVVMKYGESFEQLLCGQSSKQPQEGSSVEEISVEEEEERQIV